MNIEIQREEIISGLQKAASIIPMKTGAAFLRTIWIESKDNVLKIMSTDSKLEFTGFYSAKTNEEGLIGVQGKNFFELFRKLPAENILLRTDQNRETLLLEQGRRKYKIPTYDPSWFQDFTSFPEENAIKLSGKIIKEILERISFCISDDNTDPMHCMKIIPISDNTLNEVCGLNGHQFAMLRFKNKEFNSLLNGESILIAKPYLIELKRWINFDELYFTIDDKRVFFTNENKNEIISLPLNYDKFPNYELFFSYFNEETTKMIINRENLIDSLERIIIFNTETQRCCYFVFGENELIIYSQGQDKGEATEVIPINYNGNLDRIIFSTKNLIEILNHFQSEEVVFEFTSSQGPCKISGEQDQDYIVIIMPVVIQEETYYTEEYVE